MKNERMNAGQMIKRITIGCGYEGGKMVAGLAL